MYATIALSNTENSTSAVVKLLGPGMTPSQCEERLRPHFEKIEPAMTIIAEELLNSTEFTDVMLSYGETDKFLLTDSATGTVVLSDTDDAPFDPQHFQSISKEGGYYAAGKFDKRDGVVFASSSANCGVPLYEWVRLRLGMGWSEGSERLPVAWTGYVYNRNGVDEFDPCPTSITDPDPVVFCQISLNPKWLWSLEYFDFAHVQSIQDENDLPSER